MKILTDEELKSIESGIREIERKSKLEQLNSLKGIGFWFSDPVCNELTATTYSQLLNIKVTQEDGKIKIKLG